MRDKQTGGVREGKVSGREGSGREGSGREGSGRGGSDGGAIARVRYSDPRSRAQPAGGARTTVLGLDLT